MARWVDHILKPFARDHPAYLQDKRHLSEKIEKLNEEESPFNPDTTWLVTRDIENYYPSCDTDKCLEAIKVVLNRRPSYWKPSTDCVLEALRITMTSNNCVFMGRNFTQIDGGSITDIYGAVIIDKKAVEECLHNLGIYRRYRDDTIDVV